MSTSVFSSALTFNDAIQEVKLNKLPFAALYEPFLNTEFFVLVEISDKHESVTTEQFRFHIIELQNEPMVVLGESNEILSTIYVQKKMSAIKMLGRELLKSIHPEVGVTFVWKEGDLASPLA